MSLYEQIGEDRLREILRDFYQRCFDDVMISHFFFGKDHEELLKHQLAFTRGMLGGPNRYEGRAIAPIHKPLLIRPPQFMRRRMLLKETMRDHKLELELAEAWSDLEDRLKSLVLMDYGDCRS